MRREDDPVFNLGFNGSRFPAKIVFVPNQSNRGARADASGNGISAKPPGRLLLNFLPVVSLVNEIFQNIVYTSRFVRVILAQGPC